MRSLAVLAGSLLILAVLWEVFETIILPRRVARKFRVTRFFYLGTWQPWRFLARYFHSALARETFLSFFGPASLLFLFCVWAAALILAYGVVFWGLKSPLASNSGLPRTVWADLYFSASTFFTLGLGDLLPQSPAARIIATMEAGNGFGFLGLVITYLPTLYASFSNREVNISLLDARAGSPATAGEMLRRHGLYQQLQALDFLLADWEKWSATLMESHISYPVLCYFRSQHANQSWLAALTSILDACALIMIGLNEMPDWQARLTFAICRHALVDLTQTFHRTPLVCKDNRLPPEEWDRLREELHSAKLTVGSRPDAYSRLESLRALYEPYANALSDFLLMPLPEWTRRAGTKDNWTAGFWEHEGA